MDEPELILTSLVGSIFHQNRVPGVKPLDHLLHQVERVRTPVVSQVVFETPGQVRPGDLKAHFRRELLGFALHLVG